MDLLLSALAGLVQGLTEFLPISSTAHLTLFGRAFDLVDPRRPEEWTAYIAVLQMGTLGAVIAYFRQEIVNISFSFLKENVVRPRSLRSQSRESSMGWLVILGTVPVGIIGLLLKDIIEGPWTKNLILIACAQIIFALLLLLAEKIANHTRDSGHIGWKDALGVGIGQAFALIPGASRSGSTLTAALFMGLNRSDAARFSFLLSIPAILLSGMLELASVLPSLTLEMVGSYSAGILTAAISGYASIAFLIRYLQKNSTSVFIVYRLLLGAGLLIAILTESITA